MGKYVLRKGGEKRARRRKGLFIGEKHAVGKDALMTRGWNRPTP